MCENCKKAYFNNNNTPPFGGDPPKIKKKATQKLKRIKFMTDLITNKCNHFFFHRSKTPEEID